MKHDNYKPLLDEFFCDIRNNQGSRWVFSAEPKAEADNTHRDLDYLGYHKKRILKLFYYTLFWRK